MKTLILKNYQLNTVGKVLNYPMPFQIGRAKNRFIRVLSDKNSLVEGSRQEMAKELSISESALNKEIRPLWKLEVKRKSAW